MAASSEGSPITTVVVVIVAAVVLAGVFGGEDVTPPGPVLLAGDSLLYMADDEMETALTGDGWDVTIEAQPGAGIGGGGYTDVDWPARLEQLTAGRSYEVVIIELGTNGCAGCASVSSAIDDVMETVTDAKLVLWLDVRTDAPKPDDPDAINEALRQAQARWPDLEVLSYDEWLDGRTGFVTGDGVHLTQAGQLALVQHVRAALRERADMDG